MEPRQLVMVVLKEGRFVGKVSREEVENIMGSPFSGQVTLEDACNMHDVITQNGVLTAAMYMGTLDIHVGEGETCIICPIEPKTSYFQTYYQSVSGLQVSSAIKQ